MNRKDKKGRILKTNEFQRSDGRYAYKYKNIYGKQEVIYSWKLLSTDRLPQGKRPCISLRELEERIEHDLQDGITPETETKKITLNELFEIHLNLLEIQPQTKINYRDLWEHHVQQELGQMPVVQIKVSHVKLFYSRMAKKGYAHATIKILHTQLKAALELAVDDDMIRKNPARKAFKDFGEKPKKRFALSQEQQKRLLAFVADHSFYKKHYDMIIVMLGTALRVGELIGLTRSDIQAANHKICINHQLVYKDFQDGQGYCFHAVDPKTEAGNRVLPVTDEVWQALQRIMRRQKVIGGVEVDGYRNFIFTGTNGKPMMPAAINNFLYNIVAAYNKEEEQAARREKREAVRIPKFSAHVLRHTGCTRMAEKGIDPKVLQYIMGHSDISVTMNVYNHIADQQRIVQELEKLSELDEKRVG